MPDFSLERAAGGCVAGIDEAGRGPLAGPVIAAAVILDPATLPGMLRDGIDDSKVLTKCRREELFAALRHYADIGIGGASAAEIDRINILAATLRAMGRAVDALGIVPDLALIDGNRTPELACPATAVVRGDQASLSIAAASIVAKVTRDRIMATLARRHPGFGWERNAGYGTAEHKQALTRLGVTPHHRKTFAPINKILSLS
ncbi:MAG: ribonuclease HII [Proteobacteria bacterium]|nr:ribonuclease HII [Pseudomonadota bacterium]